MRLQLPVSARRSLKTLQKLLDHFQDVFSRPPVPPTFRGEGQMSRRSSAPSRSTWASTHPPLTPQLPRQPSLNLASHEKDLAVPGFEPPSRDSQLRSLAQRHSLRVSLSEPKRFCVQTRSSRLSRPSYTPFYPGLGVFESFAFMFHIHLHSHFSPFPLTRTVAPPLKKLFEALHIFPHFFLSLYSCLVCSEFPVYGLQTQLSVPSCGTRMSQDFL